MNRTLPVALMALFAPLFITACVKQYVPDHEPKPEPEPDPDKIENVSDLKIESFCVGPCFNERIYGRVKCVPSNDSTRWSGSILSYRADLTGVVAEFDAVADRITVGGVEQVSGVTPNDFSSPVVYRLYTSKGEYREFTVEIDNPEDSYSGFPVLAIMTDNEAPITNREKWIEGRMVIDAQQGSCAEFSGNIFVKGRGNNSWMWDKKPYALKLENRRPLMGMKPHKRWALLANSLDKTLLRNRVAFELGKRTSLPWTPDSRYVDVLLNGRFMGNYLLCEQIRVDENRVNIVEGTAGTAPEDVGYLLEMDRYYNDANKFRSEYMDLPVNIKSPDEKVLTDAQRAYITGYVNELERRLYEGDIDASYRDMLDIDTFIDWWIVVELTGNHDVRLPGSCFLYKDAGGKMCAGPLWDFDLLTFRSWNYFMLCDHKIDPSDEPVTETNPNPRRSIWLGRLFEDPVFKARAKERWIMFRDGFADIDRFIDSEAAQIAVSAGTNWKIWSVEGNANDDSDLSWEEAVENMKSNYATRLQWLDRQISEW